MTLHLTDEAFAERRYMLLKIDRWMQIAIDTRDKEYAIEGLLREIDGEERKKPTLQRQRVIPIGRKQGGPR